MRYVYGLQAQLVGVQQIYASDGAFAALTRQGTVVAWGHPGLRRRCAEGAGENLGPSSYIYYIFYYIMLYNIMYYILYILYILYARYYI